MKGDCMRGDTDIHELVLRISLEDNTAAYKELFLLLHKRLLNFSYSITKSKQSAEEVVSDVFLKLWHNRKTLTHVQNLHLYIYTMTKNFSINQLLKDKRSAFFSLDDLSVEVVSFAANPEQLLISGEILARVQSAIDNLPNRCKLIFKLVKEDGLKYKEVAELLEISPKTVEAQMTIAIKKVGEAIQFYASRIALN